MHELGADRTTIGITQGFENIAQGHGACARKISIGRRKNLIEIGFV